MPISEPLYVQAVEAERLYTLRRRVLRGDDPAKNVADPRDNEETAVHFGAFRGDVLVGAGSFYPSDPPRHTHLRSVQLRYLATDFDAQNRGVGSLLLRAAESRLTSSGVEQLWANGRDSALGFYDRQRWQRLAGSEHLSPETNLAHTVIDKVLRQTNPVTNSWGTPSDAAVLASLREEMYFAISLREFGSQWIERSREFFEEHIDDGTLIAAVARTDAGEVVSSAVATLRRVAPTPRFPLGHSAYVHSVSTRPGFRRRGVARSLMRFLVDELDRRGLERVELHATDQGESMYQEMGFVVRTWSPEMRLGLREETPS